jgi:hypothetical protein
LVNNEDDEPSSFLGSDVYFNNSNNNNLASLTALFDTSCSTSDSFRIYNNNIGYDDNVLPNCGIFPVLNHIYVMPTSYSGIDSEDCGEFLISACKSLNYALYFRSEVNCIFTLLPGLNTIFSIHHVEVINRNYIFHGGEAIHSVFFNYTEVDSYLVKVVNGSVAFCYVNIYVEKCFSDMGLFYTSSGDICFNHTNISYTSVISCPVVIGSNGFLTFINFKLDSFDSLSSFADLNETELLVNNSYFYISSCHEINFIIHRGKNLNFINSSIELNCEGEETSLLHLFLLSQTSFGNIINFKNSNFSNILGNVLNVTLNNNNYEVEVAYNLIIVNFSGCVFSDVTCDSCPPFYFGYNINITFSQSSFLNFNVKYEGKSSVEGGIVHVSESSVINMISSKFKSIKVSLGGSVAGTIYGGVLYIGNYSIFSISNSSFILICTDLSWVLDYKAFGGTVFVADNSVINSVFYGDIFEKCSIENGQDEAGGGGVYLHGINTNLLQPLIFYDCQFIKCFVHSVKNSSGTSLHHLNIVFLWVFFLMLLLQSVT